MPAYIAFYAAPQVARRRFYSDTMGRLTFIMFIIFSVPVRITTLTPIRA
jgi:cytochrome c oxidase subunit 1